MGRPSGPKETERAMEVWEYQGFIMKPCHSCSILHKLINTLCTTCTGRVSFEMNNYVYQEIPIQGKYEDLKAIKALHRKMKHGF